jgi:hypothetical protein
MSQAWDVYRSREEVLHAMIEKADAMGYFREPWNSYPQVWDAFDSPEQILQEMFQHWNSALSGAVALAVEDGEGELYDDVIAAFAGVVNNHRALRRILETHAENELLAPLMRREHAMLSSVAGVTWSDLHLPVVGEIDEVPVTHHGWLHRVFLHQPATA